VLTLPGLAVRLVQFDEKQRKAMRSGKLVPSVAGGRVEPYPGASSGGTGGGVGGGQMMMMGSTGGPQGPGNVMQGPGVQVRCRLWAAGLYAAQLPLLQWRSWKREGVQELLQMVWGGWV
jgi:hypothetical protein